MDKASYLKAVRKAERIFGYIAVMPDHNVPTRLSKVKAAALVKQCDESDDIDAMWACDDEQFLLIG